MKQLIIIGARAFGREVYDLAIRCDAYSKDFQIKGFLDDNANALDQFNNYPKIISSVESYQISEEDIFVCALGDVKWKKKYTNIILDKGGVFFNLIHPTAQINSNVKLGKGLIVLNGACISSDCQLGDFITIQPYAVLGHDCKIGNWCALGAYSFMGGFVVLENEVTLHPRSSVLPHKKVGTGSTVGASSLVIKNVNPGITVFGIPAKVLKF